MVSRYSVTVKADGTVIYTPDKGAKPFFSQGAIDFDVMNLNEITKNEKEIITLAG